MGQHVWKYVERYAAVVKPQENKVIHSLERPLFQEPGLKILRGNLSPNGAIVRPTAVYDEVKYMKGKAKVFEGDRSAFEQFRRANRAGRHYCDSI